MLGGGEERKKGKGRKTPLVIHKSLLNPRLRIHHKRSMLHNLLIQRLSSNDNEPSGFVRSGFELDAGFGGEGGEWYWGTVVREGEEEGPTRVEPVRV
jgi:hypothetical protein